MGPLFWFYPVITVIIVIIVASVIGYFVKTVNQQKISMIEKGMNPDGDLSVSEYRKQNNLKNGILLLSLGVGLFTGHVLVLTIHKLDHFLTYLTMVLVFLLIIRFLKDQAASRNGSAFD